jgi:hypothetical protein
MANSNIVVSVHPSMAMKRLEDDEIERQLKCKICDVGLCIFGFFKKYHTKARFNYMTRGVGCGACIYIKQITTKKKKVCTLNFTLIKDKYSDCVCFY